MTLVRERFAEIEHVLPEVDMPFSVHYCQFSDIKSPPWVSCKLMSWSEGSSLELKPSSASVTVNSWFGVAQLDFGYWLCCKLATAHSMIIN
jgi:hypothetical protein